MRSHEFITEIAKLPASGYAGGSKDLKKHLDLSDLKKLPGGSDYLYNITGSADSPVISIWDPRVDNEQPKIIGRLRLHSDNGTPFKNSLRVADITVDETYRGSGIAKSLYGIALSIMRITLVSGSIQTPGGRRNWASLNTIPGVEVQGLIKIHDGYLDSSLSPNANHYIDTIMGEIGAQYLGYRAPFHYFSFVVTNRTDIPELLPIVQTSLNKLYGDRDVVATSLYAIWTGRQ